MNSVGAALSRLVEKASTNPKAQEVSDLDRKTSASARECISLLKKTNLFMKNTFVVQDVTGVFSSTYAFVQHFKGAPSSQGMEAGFGLLSGLSFIYSVGGIYTQVRNFKTAQKIKDYAGQFFATILIGRYVNSFVSAAVELPAKVITLVNMSKANSVGKTALPILGYIGSACGMAINSILIVPSAVYGLITLKKLLKMEGSTKGTPEEKNKAAFEYLRSELELTDAEKAKIAAIPEEELPQGELTDKEQAVLSLSDCPDGNSLGRRKAIATKKISKEMTFNRIFGAKTRELLRTALDKGEELSSAEIAAVVSSAKKSAQFRVFYSVLGVVSSLLAISAIVAGIVGTGGGVLLAALILSLVSIVLATALDSYDLIKELKNKKISQEDKILIGVINASIAIATAVASAFSSGLAPLLISVIGGSLMILFQLLISYIARKEDTNSLQQKSKAVA